MKTYILSLIVLSILPACHKREELSTTYSVAVSEIVDITDRLVLMPDEMTVRSLFNMEVNKNEQAFFRHTYTTDKAYNPLEVCILKSKTDTDKENTNDNILYRQQCVLEYYHCITSIIEASNKQRVKDTSLAYTECFKAITKELTVLTKLPHTKKYLLCFSDLAENSNLFNSYNLRMHNPESTINQLVKLLNAIELMPKSLTGITVILIYQPINRNEDARFQIMSAVYTKLIEKKGGTVIISTNSKNLQT
ncbi:MAG: hypothetical protein IPI46_13820 [Bacteroidetes bacterium]|nr:hypothetical protein [Bacteroidota bacterium]